MFFKFRESGKLEMSLLLIFSQQVFWSSYKIVYEVLILKKLNTLKLQI